VSSDIPVVVRTELPDLPLLKRGKVRDLYDLGDSLLIVATDRISAFDSILPTGIPLKGKILTALSDFWFDMMADLAPNHVITTDVADMGEAPARHAQILAGRTTQGRKAEVLPVECVVRGYLAGSAWLEYQHSSSVCGVSLPAGLSQSDKLPQPIFTPATKAESGHDENISFDTMADLVGTGRAAFIRDRSIAIYERAAQHALARGVIICDTKLEWGTVDDGLVLIDELLTPDSSRFWPLDSYQPGGSPPSFDKQFVRDYLNEIGWDHEPPAPELPDEVVNKTTEKYLDALKRLTGKAVA